MELSSELVANYAINFQKKIAIVILVFYPHLQVCLSVHIT